MCNFELSLTFLDRKMKTTYSSYDFGHVNDGFHRTVPSLIDKDVNVF